MRVLITGGFGYIGGRLGEYLKRAGHQVVLGSRRASNPPGWLLEAEVTQIVWEDEAALERVCQGVDVIVHAAGMNAQDSAKAPVAALEFNGVTTARLVRVASRAGVKRFIYLSTAHVYASPLVGTITEESCPRNLHPYATSHLAGEQAVLYAHQKNGMEAVVLRLSNAFGAPTHKEVNCWSLLTNDLCRQSVERKQLTLYSDGSQQRDFVAMSEVCRVIGGFVAVGHETLAANVFNVGAGSSISLLEMVRTIQERCCDVLGYRPEIIAQSGHNEGVGLVYRVEQLEKIGIKVKADLTKELDTLLLFCKREFGLH